MCEFEQWPCMSPYIQNMGLEPYNIQNVWLTPYHASIHSVCRAVTYEISRIPPDIC